MRIGSEDRAKIEDYLIEQRMNPENKDKHYRDMVNEIKDFVPSVDISALKSIERDPEFINRINSRVASMLLPYLSESCESLGKKAAMGSDKHLSLFFKVLQHSRDKYEDTNTSKKEIQSSLSDDEVVEEYWNEIQKIKG